MDSYNSPTQSPYRDEDEAHGPYYSYRRQPESPPRPSPMQLTYLLNPDQKAQIPYAIPIRNNSHSPKKASYVPPRPTLPSLSTSYLGSYSVGHYERSLSYSSSNSAQSHSPPDQMRRNYSSSSDVTRSDSESPAIPNQQFSYPSPYSPATSGHSRQDIEAAQTLTSVGTGSYPSGLSPPTPESLAESPNPTSNLNINGPTGASRQYPCPLAAPFACTKKFSTSGHARRHSRTHTGERTAQCPDCGHRFSRQDNMQQHRRTHKPGRTSRRGGSRRVEEEEKES